jgi:hypothetical protein
LSADGVLRHGAVESEVSRPPHHGAAGVGHCLRAPHLVGMDRVDLPTSHPPNEAAVGLGVVNPRAVVSFHDKAAACTGSGG